ncbi:MAG: glycosyl transferase [Rubrimonas sp.]|uniref:glycosyl transferase n=1 Tax=Rubrimonas sp. TaxID=2036015 RepID=UPI002FDD70CE
MNKQVVCINWGPKYGAPYINRLYAMVARHLTPPFNFTCFTDSAAGVRPEVRCEPLPELDVPMPVRTWGKWPKARMWSARLADLEGPVLFMDLDLVVTGSLDDFFTFGDADDVILARNPTVPLERLGQTSIFRFPVGKLLPLQEEFAADPQGIADRYHWEQRFVTRRAPGGVKFWPRPWVKVFRRECCRPFPLNYVLAPRLPRGARVVLFPGILLPSHAIEGRWGDLYDPTGPIEHIRNTFHRRTDQSVWRYLRHYLKPSDWVREAWRED